MRIIVPVSLTIGLLSLGLILAIQPRDKVNRVTSIKVDEKQSEKVKSTPGDPVIAAVGDIACDPTSSNYNQGNGTADRCHMKATSDLLIDANLTAVLPLGDNQYENGSLEAFQKSYDPTWGRVKSITRPVAGNHEYHTSDAYGYFKYFGATAAGDWSKGYYSYNIGNWHIIALNSNCSQVGGCKENSPQQKWLKADLAKYRNTCTLAYWHHPRFSSGMHGNNSDYDIFWKDLYNAGVEVVLNGHDHDYERFAPQTPNAQADPIRGIRQFVVGTGGKSHYDFGKPEPNSEVRNADTYGVLMLTLHPDSYSWRFVPESDHSFTDSGSDNCH